MVDDFVGANDAFRKALDFASPRIATHAYLALNTLAQGRPEEAVAEATREPEDGFRLWALAIVHRARGDEAASEAALRRLIDTHADGWALQIAEVQAARGEVDAAFEWLDRAYAKRDTGLAHLLADQRLRPLACGCREIPRTVLKELRRRGAEVPVRRQGATKAP